MRWFLLVLCVVWAGSALAQTNDDDRDWITGLIEDTISNDEMTVRLDNFEGALSSEATADAITIADPDGVWLRLEGLTLQWNRSALLSGRVEIEQLAAERIELVRLPAANDDVDLPSAEATPFALPDLPVSVEIQNVSAGEIVLTEDLLGEPVVAQFEGALSLIDGTATTQIELERTDDKTGAFNIDASYVQDTRQLGLFLLAQEGADGIAARLIDLPGRPALRLEVSGDAPLDDFVADIALATDGVDRVTGTAQIARPEGTLDQAFALDLNGDLRPLLDDEYDAFFGANTVLRVSGTSYEDGSLELTNLLIGADQLVLRGAAALDAQGWPEVIDLRGRLASGQGGPVLLPIGGVATQVGGVALNVTYDAAQGDTWTGTFDISSFSREGITIDALTLSGDGILVPGEGDGEGRFTADLDYGASGLNLNDPALNQAIGSDIEGTVSLARIEDGPLSISELTVSGAGLDGQGRALIQGPENRFQSEGELTIEARDFSRFAALSGLADLSGGGRVQLRGDVQPFDGIFDVFLSASTSDLTVGIDQLDPVLEGDAVLSLQVDRDTTGTRLQTIQLTSDAVTAQGSGEITGETAAATFRAALTDLALVEPSLSGPANVQADVTTDPQGRITLEASVAAPNADADIQAIATPIEGGYDVTGTGDVEIEDLRAYGNLIDQPLSGSALVQVRGNIQPTNETFDVAITASTSDLAVGIEQVDPLLDGDAVLSLQIDRNAIRTRLQSIRLDSDAVTAQGSGEIAGETATATFAAALTDLGLIEPSLSGPANVQADVATDPQGQISLQTNITAPSAAADIDATASPIDGGFDIAGTGDIQINDLRAYGNLINQPLSGGVSLELDGRFNSATTEANADVMVLTTDLGVGSDPANRILAGLGRITAAVGLSSAGRLSVDGLDVIFPNLTASGSVASSGSDTQADLSVRLRDIALLVSDFSGPLVADVSARQDESGWQISGSADGPVQTAAQVSGRVSNSGNLDLSLNGSAPLALANLYIAPRQINGLATFALNVQGPPDVGSVSGRVGISDARLAAPTLQQAVENINGSILLNNGSARLDFSGSNADGGQLAISGPIVLTAPYRAELVVSLADFVVQDPTLYRTTAQGQVTVTGPLTGGAAIAGTINLGQVDVQVPSTGVSALGSLPEVTHLGIPTRVAQTLARADIGVNGGSDTEEQSNSGAAYPLDLLVRAPSRIFVRGRGLDAELGGQLRLTGTTNVIIPIGRFDLVRGRLSILSQRFDLDEGFAQLQGDFSPYLRLVATTESSTGTDISIIVEGPADGIEVSFESSPELPQDEVLAQLLFGRDLTSISPLQAVQLASAVATLSGRSGGGVVDRVREGLDLDDLDFVTDEDGNAAVRAGKYISERVYTDVTVGVEGESEINLNFDIDRNFTARGSVTSEGETSVGIFFERDY